MGAGLELCAQTHRGLRGIWVPVKHSHPGAHVVGVWSCQSERQGWCSVTALLFLPAGVCSHCDWEHYTYHKCFFLKWKWGEQSSVGLCCRARWRWQGWDTRTGLAFWAQVCQRLWGRDVQGTHSAPYSLNSLCRLTLPALLREGSSVLQSHGFSFYSWFRRVGDKRECNCSWKRGKKLYK